MESKNKGGRPKGRPKTGGRKKGTPNVITQSSKAWITELINNNRGQIEKDIKSKKLAPRDRLAFFEKLLQYVVPKQQATAATIEFERLTDEQLNNVITDITTTIQDD